MFILLSSSTKIDRGVKLTHLVVHRMLCAWFCVYVHTIFMHVPTVWAAVKRPSIYSRLGIY